MANKKETNVDSILAAAGAKMGVKEPPTGTPPQEPQFDMAEAPITGPIDFGKMRPVDNSTTHVNISGMSKGVIPSLSKANVFLNDDERMGKAFNIAIKTFKKYRTKKVDDFIELVNDIKANL